MTDSVNWFQLISFYFLLAKAIAKWKGNPPEIPIVIGGQEYHTGNVKTQVSVSYVWLDRLSSRVTHCLLLSLIYVDIF